MIPMLFSEARAYPAAGPFSFQDSNGLRVSRINICGQNVVTPANCVEEFHGGLIVTTWVRPLVGD